MPSISVLIVLAAVTGGTPQQHADVDKVLKGLPECLTKPGGTPVPVAIVQSGALNASYSPTDESLTINDTLLDPATRTRAVDELAADQCADPKAITLFDDTRRVILHELAHAYFHKKLMESASPGFIRATKHANELLGLRFRQAQETWYRDPVRIETQTKNAQKPRMT